MILGFFGGFFAFAYITGGVTFPDALDQDNERALVERLENGTQEERTEARNALIVHNLRLVAFIVKKYGNHIKDMDDLLSVGTIGLIKAISTYSSKKGAKLGTYAVRCINNEILMYLRASKKYANDTYLQEPVGIDKDGNEVTVEDKLGDDRQSVDEQVNLKHEIKTLYEKMRCVLRDREKTVIELRYGLVDGNEITQREIAKILGISRSYVSRIEKKALKKLNFEISKGG